MHIVIDIRFVDFSCQLVECEKKVIFWPSVSWTSNVMVLAWPIVYASNIWYSCCRKVIKFVIQGFLPGIALKIFLDLLPSILMTMSKVEGFTSFSCLERKSVQKYYFFILVNVFLGSIVTGTTLQQLKKFLNEPSTE